jgi:ferrochelatase
MKGVLLTAYGTPHNLDDVERYYTHIRGGRSPSPLEVEELVRRYRAIGGTSPLTRITEGQRNKLQSKLNEIGSNTKVYYGMKHSEPFIRDAVKSALDDGVDTLLGLALAPHYSKMSIGSYIQMVEEANVEFGNELSIRWVKSWNTNPKLIQSWCHRIEDAQQEMCEGYYMIFSAHSLPERIIADGDPYREQLLETSTLIAMQTRIERWTFAFQSAARTSERWLGPDLISTLQKLYEKGERNFLVAPIGFVSDHLEVLYDIDIVCKEWARGVGARLLRVRSLNDSDDFADCLFSIVSSMGFV